MQHEEGAVAGPSELMDTEEEDEPASGAVGFEPEDMSVSESGDTSSGMEYSGSETDDPVERLAEASEKMSELRKKLKLAQQRTRRQSGRIDKLRSQEEKRAKKFLLKSYSHAWTNWILGSKKHPSNRYVDVVSYTLLYI